MKRGQMLVEIIVVIGVVVVLTTSLVILSTLSLKNSRLGKLRSQAVKYAQEGMEYVRQRRDENWEEFQALDGMWCLQEGGGWNQSTSCTLNVANQFDRTVEFTWNEPDQRMEVTVSVAWFEGDQFYETNLQSSYTER